MKSRQYILPLIILVCVILAFSYERNKLKAIRSEIAQLPLQFETALLQQNDQIQSVLGRLRQDFVDDLKVVLATRDRQWMLPSEPQLSRAHRVAHAGGAYNGLTYTNSLEALEANKNDFQFFEIDLALTSDEEVVCSHDWDHYPKQIFGVELNATPSLAEFTKLVADNSKFTNCTLDTLVDWLNQNPGATIITDSKERNLEVLAHIATRYPALISRFIPQIYNMREYQPTLELGYSSVILTIYKWSAPEVEIVERVRGKKLFAVTVPFFRAPYIGKRLKEAGHRVYAHTINTAETLSMMRWFGVDEIYTDHLHGDGNVN